MKKMFKLTIIDKANGDVGEKTNEISHDSTAHLTDFAPTACHYHTTINQ